MDGLTAAEIALIAFQTRQFYYYKIMKKQAIAGRNSAIETACRYAFLNSGISSKLKSCRLEDISLCDGCEEACARGCKQECGDDDDCLDTCSREELNCLIDNCQSQQAEFQLWLKDLGSAESVEYTWIDGQGRGHKVHVGADGCPMIESVNSYKLRLTVLPTAALLALLDSAHTVASVSAMSACRCCPAAAGVAAAAAGAAAADLSALLAGLLPGLNFDASGFVEVMFPICWVTDINHNRLVGVPTWQEHEGEDYGSMGETEYPHIESFSVVNFRDDGEIYYPYPYFDAAIIKTDASGTK